MERIIIEVLGRNKQVVERVVCKEFPVIIGRGYVNDVIVSDPYVAEKQLVLTKIDERWQIENLENINAIFLNDAVQNEMSFEIHSGDKITIGETTLRIVSSIHTVPATKKFSRRKEYLTATQCIVIAWTSVILALACFSVIEFLDTARTTSWIKILARPLALPLTTIPIGWAVLWASIGRTLNLMPNFHKHLFVSTIVEIAARWTVIFSDYLQYILNSEVTGKIFFYLVVGLLIIVLLNTNLKLATTLSRLQRIGMVNVCAWGGVLLFEFFMIAQQPEFQNWTNFNSTLKPPYINILPTKPVNEFFANTDTLFEEVDKRVEKEGLSD